MVCNHVASGQIPDADWRIIRRYVKQHYKYAISPLTMIELLRRLEKGSDTYFERNRKALQVLYEIAPRTILRFPGEFLLNRALSATRNNPKFQPRLFDLWMRVALKAKNKQELKAGTISLGGLKAIVYELDLSSIDKQHSEGIAAHVKQLNDVRTQKRSVASRLQFAAGIFSSLGRPLKTTERQRALDALDASYSFDSWLCSMAKNQSYDFAKHHSDWVDLQQLQYLCDSNVHVLTDDKDLKRETASSKQADQVVTVKDLLLAAKSV